VEANIYLPSEESFCLSTFTWIFISSTWKSSVCNMACPVWRTALHIGI